MAVLIGVTMGHLEGQSTEIYLQNNIYITHIIALPRATYHVYDDWMRLQRLPTGQISVLDTGSRLRAYSLPHGGIQSMVPP